MGDSRQNEPFEPNGLTISYKGLGTINIDEFVHALLEDIQILRDQYNVRYVKAPKVKLYFTNEYGEPVRISKPGGGRAHFIDTYHYRPACKDYDL